MLKAWILCGAGTLFCLGGLYLFYRSIYEADKNILKPIIIIIAGIVLITAGTARLVF